MPHAHLGGASGEVKTVEIPYVSASAHLGQGKRLTEKETIKWNPSKTLVKQRKTALRAGLEGNG